LGLTSNTNQGPFGYYPSPINSSPNSNIGFGQVPVQQFQAPMYQQMQMPTNQFNSSAPVFTGYSQMPYFTGYNFSN
jgi:hypothetical protein